MDLFRCCVIDILHCSLPKMNIEFIYLYLFIWYLFLRGEELLI